MALHLDCHFLKCTENLLETTEGFLTNYASISKNDCTVNCIISIIYNKSILCCTPSIKSRVELNIPNNII